MPASEAAIEAIGGAVGSCVAIGVTYPLTTVSTWQALDHTSQESEQPPAAKHLPSPFRELVLYSRERGWKPLFAGLKPCLAATAVSQGVYFYLYSKLRQAVVSHKLQGRGGPQTGVVNSRTEDIGVLGSLVVASLAGCGNVLVTNPVWVVATQMQALQKRAGGGMTASQVASMLYQEGGIKAFWKGLAPALVMVMNPTLQYILYEWLVARLLELKRKSTGSSKAKLATKDVFLLTALAKMGSTLVTYPLLLIKSRLQAMNSQTDAAARYHGVLHAVSRILKAEGMSGFFKGIRVKMIQTVLAAALLMSIKEQVYLSTRKVLLGAALTAKS